MKILIADDQAMSRKLLRLTLAAEGHDVSEASDGQEALDLLAQTGFDLVISDILMPGMDGYRFCYEVRRRSELQKVPVIIYSSTYTSPTEERVALQMGADVFLRKPAPAAEILKAVSEITRHARQPTAPPAAGDELLILKQYSERLVQKLEEKNLELEAAQAKLSAAYDRLERSEKRFRELVEQAPIGIIQTAPDGLFIAANSSFAHMLGYSSPQELMGLELSRDVYADPSDHEKVLDVANRRDPASAVEVQLKKRDGSSVWVQADCRPVRDASGKVLRYEIFTPDVTERRRAEGALRESEERYRLLFENNPQPMWVFELGTLAFLAVNASACRHYGYTREEFLAMRISDIRPPSEVPPLMRHLEEHSDELQRSTGWRHRLKDGTLIDVEITSHPMNFGGRPAELVLSTDVTERKKAEVALRESEQRFRQVTESIDQVFWLTDVAKNQMIYVSPAYEKIWGRPCAMVYGSPQSRLGAVHPDDKARVQKAALTLQAVGDYDLEYRIVRPDGSVRWINERAFPIPDEHQRVYRIAGVATDITDRRQAETEIRRSEERFRRLFESNTIGIVIADLDGVTLEANDVYLDMLGYRREELVAGLLRWDDLTPPEYRAADQAAVEALRSTGVAPAWEKEMLRKDGTRVPVLLGVAMLEASEASCIAYIVDLSKPRQLELQLRQAQKMEAVGQLAGGVAHDFNNLLTAILGYTELAVSRVEPDSKAFDELEEVRKAGERAAGLTRQLLAFSRRQVLEPRVLDLNAIVGDLEKMLRRLIGEDIDFVTTLDPSLGRVRADAGEIEQVIMNLAVNARDAMPGGGKLTVETANVELDEAYASKHVSARGGRFVMLAVSDTGSGMDAETQSHIFEPFFTTKDKDKGTGLGLSTVYGIVKQSGGWIWVYSELARGTTLKIYLPEVEDAAEMPERRVETSRAGGSETILLAEDEQPVRKLARAVLENMGYTVLEASRGEDALSIARSHAGTIDLVLTDVVMPEMGGQDLVARLQELRPQIRVLFMSGYTDNAVIRHKVLERGTHFLQKPFTAVSLTRKVREALS